MASEVGISAAIGLQDSFTAPLAKAASTARVAMRGALEDIQRAALGASLGIAKVSSSTDSLTQAAARYQREAEGITPIDQMRLELTDARAKGLSELAMMIERNIAVARIEQRVAKGEITNDRARLEIQIVDIEQTKRLSELKAKKSAETKKAGEAAKKAGADARRGAGGWKRLGDRLRSVRSTIGKFVGLGSLVGGVSVVGAAGGIMRLVDGHAQATDVMAKFASRVGMGIETLQEYEYAAGIAGITSDEFRDSLSELSQRIGEAKLGEGELLTFLKRASPALLEQVKGARDNGEAFELMVQAMRQIEDPTKRAAVASKVFGESGKKMALMANLSTAELLKLRAEQEANGNVTAEGAKLAEEYADAKSRLGSAVRGVAVSVASDLLPKVTPLLGRLTEWVRANREIIATKLTNFVVGLGEALGSIDWQAVVSGIGRFVEGLVRAAEWLGPDGMIIVGIGAMGAALTLSLGPIGLVLSGVALLAVYWDDVTAAAKRALEVASEATSWLQRIPGIGHVFGGAGTSGLVRDVVGQHQADLEERAKQVDPAEFSQRMFGVSLPRLAGADGASGRVQVEVDFRNLPDGARVNTETSDPARVPVKADVGRRTLGTGAP